MFRLPKWLPTAMGLTVATVLLAVGPPARADFVLTLSDGSGDSITADQTTGHVTTTGTVSGPGGSPSISFGNGTISINASLGGFTFTVSTAVGAPAVGNPYQAELDLSNVSLSSSGSGKLTITTYQTGDSVMSGYPTGTFSSNVGGTVGSNMAITSAQAWYDPSNTGSPSGSGAVAAYNPAASASANSSFSASGSTGVSLRGNSFALMDQVGRTTSGSGVSSFDMDTTVAVPEPASMMIAFSALPALSLGYWLRRRQVRLVTAA
jgi:hypothetical protein